MKKENIEKFAALLEAAGFKGAMELITNDLIPLAKKNRISVVKAAKLYADDGEEQDTSYYQLWEALLKISKSDLASLT